MISEVLTVGLLAGFRKNSRIQRVKRCGFELKSAHFANEGMVYHDEWVDGGGQELIRASDEEFTRVYAGGVVKDEILRKLGVQKDEVIGQLIGMLTKLGEKTNQQVIQERAAEENKPATTKYQKLTLSMSLGSRVSEVKTLQQMLSKDPSIYTGPVTGYYGPLTRQAVINFQKKYGIEPTGIAGPKTRQKMNEVLVN